MISYIHAWVVDVSRIGFMMLHVQACHFEFRLIEFILIRGIVTFRCRILDRVNEPSDTCGIRWGTNKALGLLIRLQVPLSDYGLLQRLVLFNADTLNVAHPH